MAREKKKRQRGSGSIVIEKLGTAIRWPEYVIGAGGKRRRKYRYEFLGPISPRGAESRLIQRIAESHRVGPYEEKVIPTFKEHVDRWRRDVLPTYKHSVQIGHGCILKAHLVPRFGEWLVSAIGPLDVQQFMAELRDNNYAPHSVHHYHEVLRVVMREAVVWYGLARNPVVGIRLPKLKPVRKKWALTLKEAGALIGKLRPKARAIVALAIVSGMRRGELLAFRWSSLNLEKLEIQVSEAYYHGHLDSPKTAAGIRTIAVNPWIVSLLGDWRALSKHRRPEDLVFGTRTGKVENPNNVLRRQIYPACLALGIARATWLTFRYTFSTLAHENGVPAKAIAEIMGHADVDTQFVYIQGVDETKRVAAERIGEQLSRLCPDERQMSLGWVN